MTDTTSHISNAFNIGSVRLANRLVQAPMAGISGRAFRLQARRFGAGLMTTEMVSSHGIHYRNRRTQAMLELVAGEHPVAVQIFGSSPEVMAAAASAAEEAGADVIDINMGCPVRKVVKTGAGVALMGDEGLAARLTAAVARAVAIPVTVKIRSGLTSKETAPSLAARLEEAGAAAICIHPRTAAQGQKGQADHSLSLKLAAALLVPVIASGDIEGPGQAGELISGGCAAIMIGRASLGNPWIYEDMLGGAAPWRRPLEAMIAQMGRFYQDAVDEMGRERAPRYMRKFYGWFLKPFRPDAGLRHGLLQTRDFQEAESLIRQHLQV